MGTAIKLTISGVCLDYSKNSVGFDWGFLFQDSDISRRPSDSIDYEYYKTFPNEEELAESEEAFVRPLSRVLPRLEVIGYTIENARAEYKAAVEHSIELDTIPTDGEARSYLTFEEFCSLACIYPLSSLATKYIDFDTEERAKIVQGRFSAHADLFARVPAIGDPNMYWSEQSYVATMLCFLSAPAMLRIFALNPDNADAEVMWQFGPIVNAGWVDRESFQPGATRGQAILVATEGASDARILRRALDMLRPEVKDFFKFIDADERHHFWGTGNLVRFAEGLLRIDVQNSVLFLLDNDAEGVEAHEKLKKLGFPDNMRAMLLPHMEEFKSFPALGPQGVVNCDINGRAAAIECYLDLKLPQYPTAKIIWSNYKKELDIWHGALEHKESYMRHFLDQDISVLKSGAYDTSRLVKLLDALITEASNFSMEMNPAQYPSVFSEDS